jgi:hypothetical protein
LLDNLTRVPTQITCKFLKNSLPASVRDDLVFCPWSGGHAT